MEGHHLHHHHNTNHDGFGSLADLRQLMNGRPTAHHHFPTIPQAAAAVELFPGHPNLTPQGHGHHYEMLMLGRHHHQVTDLMPRGLQDFNNSSATGNNHTTAATSVNTTTGVSTPSFSGLDGDGGCSYGGDGGTGRWPRQETLTLLEIRSRLDSKFKEANQKGPLWDEVSRIMSEEHGYQRSGKKCREKFENLYKYYKKTKDGKAGRQDGKNYRFFRQLEALYGDNNNNNSNTSVSLADHQTQHLVGTTSTNTGLPFHHHTTTNCNIQDPCFNASHKLCDSLSLSNSSEFESTSSDDNVLGSHAENESSEKIKRKKKGERNWKLKIKEFIDMQMRKLVERQEAWLEKLTNTIEKKEQERISREEEWRRQEEARIDREHEFWAKERAKIEARDAALMEALRNINGGGKQGHDVISNKKRKENSRNCEYFESNESLYNQSGRAYGEIHEEEVERVRIQGNNDGSSPSNSNVGNPVNDSCLRFFMADGETNLWENYGLKLNKGEN